MGDGLATNDDLTMGDDLMKGDSAVRSLIDTEKKWNGFTTQNGTTGQ